MAHPRVLRTTLLARRTTPLAPPTQSIPGTFRQQNVPRRPTLGMRSKTRNTSNSRKSSSRSRIRNTRNSNKSRTRITNAWTNRRLTTQENSKWNNSTSGKRNNWNKNTPNNSRRCNNASNRRRVRVSQSLQSLSYRSRFRINGARHDCAGPAVASHQTYGPCIDERWRNFGERKRNTLERMVRPGDSNSRPSGFRRRRTLSNCATGSLLQNLLQFFASSSGLQILFPLRCLGTRGELFLIDQLPLAAILR